MIFAEDDVKANKNRRNKRSSGGRYLVNFYKKYLQNLKYNVKKVAMYFSFDFGWYSIHLNIINYEQKERGGGAVA